MKVYNLRCESMTNPVGISVKTPRLTWNMDSDKRAVQQESFCITVWKEIYRNGTAEKEEIFSSGKVISGENSFLFPEGLTESRVRYFWNVEVTDNYGEKSKASGDVWFEMGLLDVSDWSAKWVEPEQHPAVKESISVEEYISSLEMFDNNTRRCVVDETGDEVPAEECPAQSHEINEEILFPCPMLRKEFTVSGKLCRARMYATAHGVYDVKLNGTKAGDYMLAPEASSYRDYLQVQTYNILEYLKEGKNAIGVTLGDGWWAGRLGCTGESVRYGDTLGLLLQIELLYEDGHTEVIGTDKGFVSTCEGPRRYADLSIGEKYDMNRELNGWSETGFDDSLWIPVQEKEYSFANLKGQNAQPMKILQKLDLEDSYISPKGEKILDFGQCIAGTASMHIEGAPGETVVLRYFQVPDKEGNYYYETMGENSQMTDTIILDTEGKGEYDPLFTIHGFRYISVTSDKSNVTVSDAVARLIATEVDVTAKIHTSNPKLDKLQKNIEWTIRSNMMSILVDNPDRERSGWTGDAQMVSPAVCYTVDAQAMFRRWLSYCRYEQREMGEVPAIIPDWRLANTIATDSTAGWGDVVIHLPWHMYWKYGDIRFLEENYPMMQKWFELEKRRAADSNPAGIGEITPEREEYLKYIWNADWNWGDWMTPSACTNEKTGEIRIGAMCLCWLAGTYYYAYAAFLMEKIAKFLGKYDDAQMYHEILGKIREAAIYEFYDTGRIYESKYVGAQILALHMGFYPKTEKQKLLDRIIEQLAKNGMDTGFSSSLVLPQLLCENGMEEKMYEFLLDERNPSYLYEVDQGATAVWECMQGIQPNGDIAMCSFIQPAYCTIGNWMMEGMSGISAQTPGYRTIQIRPYFTEKLDYVESSYQSEQGEIFSRWERTDEQIIVKICIPANTKAQVILPGATIGTVSADGRLLCELNEAEGIQETEEGLRFMVGSGKYEFSWKR